jgi:hypothetical protein
MSTPREVRIAAAADVLQALGRAVGLLMAGGVALARRELVKGWTAREVALAGLAGDKDAEEWGRRSTALLSALYSACDQLEAGQNATPVRDEVDSSGTVGEEPGPA